jgi:hypothetical protein
MIKAQVISAVLAFGLQGKWYGSRCMLELLSESPQKEGGSLGENPIWHLSKALGTMLEDKVAELYLKTIGISSWGEVIHKDGIR